MKVDKDGHPIDVPIEIKDGFYYHNDLNRLPLNRMPSSVQNIFICIVSQFVGREDAKLSINNPELKQLVRFACGLPEDTPIGEERLIKIGKSMMLQLSRSDINLLRIKVSPDDLHKLEKDGVLSFFDVCVVNTDLTETVLLSLDLHLAQTFQYMFRPENLKEGAGQFTRIGIGEFTSLKSKYSKALYRLLKQYRTTGSLTVSAKKLQNYLNVNIPVHKLENKILNKTIEELGNNFKNLKMEKLFEKPEGSSGGRPKLAGFKFTFKAQHPPKKDEITDKTEKLFYADLCNKY